jgi:hypothetical protein
MPKAKMKFPQVPGNTPRERFVNLVKHVFSKPETHSQTRQRSAAKSRTRQSPSHEKKGVP